MRKLGRNSAARKALLRSILTSFFKYGRIETTEAKAKELRSLADGLITLAKRGDLAYDGAKISRAKAPRLARSHLQLKGFAVKSRANV